MVLLFSKFLLIPDKEYRFWYKTRQVASIVVSANFRQLPNSNSKPKATSLPLLRNVFVKERLSGIDFPTLIFPTLTCYIARTAKRLLYNVTKRNYLYAWLGIILTSCARGLSPIIHLIHTSKREIKQQKNVLFIAVLTFQYIEIGLFLTSFELFCIFF